MSERIFQMVRIGDILDIDSVDYSEEGTLESVLIHKQDDDWSIGPIWDGIQRYGYWKTGIIQVTKNYMDKAYFIHGDGHHRTTLFYLLLGEDGYIPMCFKEGVSYMNEFPSATVPDGSGDMLPVPFTWDEIVEFSREMSLDT